MGGVILSDFHVYDPSNVKALYGAFGSLTSSRVGVYLKTSDIITSKGQP